MAALTAARNIRQYGDDSAFVMQHHIPMKGATKIFPGALVVYDAGFAAPGRTATGLIVVGVATAKGGVSSVYDNSGGAAGAMEVQVDRGTFNFNNSSAGDAIAQANCGGPCYIVDDNTVALTNGSSTRSVAGIVRNIDADGTVWVEVTPATAI